MLHYYALATIALAAVSAFAAIVRDYPIINAFARPGSRAGRLAAVCVGIAFAISCALHFGDVTIRGVSPLIFTWPIALIYFAWCVVTNLRTAIVLLALAFPSTAFGFNFFAHRVIADIAWQELDEPTREKIVATLRRHPRFDDFTNAKRETVDAEDRWIFQYAAVWPDTARGLPKDEQRKYNNPSWHYVNFPIVLDGRPAPDFNLADGDPKGIDRTQWNILQAIAYCRRVIHSDATPQQKALAYSWLFHLVGDAHQPMHSTALVCERFNGGDRGGNLIPTVQSKNLHALWDGLLGRRDGMADVAREVTELRRRDDAWKVDAEAEPAAWIAESHELAKVFAYDQFIIDAALASGELAPINLPPAYLKAAGEHARRRVVASGLRLAALLGDLPAEGSAADADPFDAFGEATAVPYSKPRRPAAGSGFAPSAMSPSRQPLSYWLNTNTGERHNANCRWYRNTRHGRMCGPDEGDKCGLCGG
jgi:hypothetical protein